MLDRLGASPAEQRRSTASLAWPRSCSPASGPLACPIPLNDDGDLRERREVMVRTKWLTLITEGDISDFRVHWQAVAAIDSEEPLCPYKS